MLETSGHAPLERLEEVLVQLVQRHRELRLHPDPVPQHQLCEASPIDQLDARVDSIGS